MLNKEQELKKIIYQSWHRGCKETDLLLGEFAKQNIHNFDDKKLELYKELIEEPDWDIYNWVVAREETPQKYLKLIKEIKEFSLKRSD